MASESLDCLKCPAFCCRTAGYVEVSRNDIRRLAKFLKLTVREFEARHIVERNRKGSKRIKSGFGTCQFLGENRRCTVYEARPESCQKFPHIVRGAGSIASRMWEFVDRACYCPIVYNSLEAFKDELKFQR